MLNYKISNVPRYLNHTTLKGIIEKELSLCNKDFKLSYKLKQNYAILKNCKELQYKTIKIKNKDCKISTYNPKEIQKEIKGEDLSYNINDSVTPLWKLTYEEQIKNKEEKLKNFYKKDVEVVKTNNFYRNNCQFAFGFDRNEKPCVGFRGKFSHQEKNLVFNINECPNVSIKMKEIIKKIEDIIKDYPGIIHDRITRTGFLKLLMIRESEEEMIALVQIHHFEEDNKKFSYENILKDSEFKKVYDLLERIPLSNLFLQFTNSCFEGFNNSKTYKMRGSDFMFQNINNYNFKVSFFSFFQINIEIAEKIIKKISEHPFKNKILYDICCGSGLFGISLNKYFERIKGIEINEECIKDAKINICNNNIKNYEVICGNVENEKFVEKGTVILDPPRNGVGKKTIMNIRKNESINEIFYISCDYEKAYQNIIDLCRDTSNAYENEKFIVDNIIGFDMFPNTEKVEVLIHLIRN